ncbi:putative adrenomedullin-5-like protein [Cavia porcellus]|uniref:putative adrenomedullin-5-like protein n=1 Tax=Cavia porcellus TaxID=10141 RepID=UPI002FE07484
MAAPFLLLLLLATSALGARDSVERRPRAQVAQRRGRSCSLGTCQTHLLPHRLAWVRALSAKEPSGKAAREPQDPRSYGRRRRETPALPCPGIGMPSHEPGPRTPDLTLLSSPRETGSRSSPRWAGRDRALRSQAE